MKYVVEGSDQEVVQRDCKARGLSREDAMNCGRRRRLIKDR